MSQISQSLADHKISIESMIQHKAGSDSQVNQDEGATLTIVTHETAEKNILQTLKKIESMKFNLAPPFVLRVEE